MEFLSILKAKNETLFWFGTFNLLAAAFFLLAAWLKPIEFAGVNAWYKPLKFALSIGILAWTVGLYGSFLPHKQGISALSWILVISLGFELIYIGIQAARGQGSHFNLSTPFYARLYTLMALAATVATLAVGYLGIRFFMSDFPDLPQSLIWAIRLGIILFVVFSLEGFVMGSRMTHTVGAADGSPGLPLLNWSRLWGDLRVAHFVGMHALQVLPLLAYYLLKDLRLVWISFLIYAALAVWVLWQALQAKPLFHY